MTEPGKRRVSFNAFGHGLAGKVHVHTPEESEAFRVHCQAYQAEFAPVGIQETDLVQLIAENRWRLKRARSIESNIFAAGIDAHAGEIESGVMLHEYFEQRGEIYEPEDDFLPDSEHGQFVYSSAKIARILDRKFRLHQALWGRKPMPYPLEDRDAQPEAA